MRSFLQALSLLSRIPVRVSWDPEQRPGRILAWAPAVGLVLGGLLAAAAWGLSAIFAPDGPASLLPSALLLALWVALTGGLHLDGWCDGCDGLFVPASREKRLEIMKDPRAGSFGVIGTVLLLLVKVAAIQAIVSASGRGLFAWLPLLAAPVAARGAMVLAVAWLPLARPDGMGARFRDGLSGLPLALAGFSAVAVLAAVSWLTTWSLGLACGVGAAAGAAAWAMLAMRRLGGLTGDVYGGIVELGETVALIAATVMVKPL